MPKGNRWIPTAFRYNTGMRINKFVASASGMSRRAADAAIEQGRVLVDGQRAQPGQDITEQHRITLDGTPLHAPSVMQTIMLNKPEGVVVSRRGQGSRTIYDLLPPELHALKPVGRLDKESSGLLLLTTNGDLAHNLTHPSFQKTKIYEVTLNQRLAPLHRQMISEQGIQLEDGPSQLGLERLQESDDRQWRVIMHEGRNRQIRRTFDALGYGVTRLHRTQFGAYELGSLKPGSFIPI
jgi:23S rRNA pseudouridine2605 synthase